MTVYKYNRNNICWQQVERLVFQWQHKIYQASISGNKNQIYFIQNKLIRSTIRKLISIRRGINNFEKQFIKSRYTYFFSYSFNFEISIKKVIYEKKKIEKVQCFYVSSIINSYTLFLINLALEPEWERKFSRQDQNNCRFRIGFQYHDMMENIRKRFQNPTYFTNISVHRINVFRYIFVLEKTHINPQNYILFQDWFKRNFLKKDKKLSIRVNKTIYRKNIKCFFFKNIVLHGIEQNFIEKISKKIKHLRNFQRSKWIRSFGYIRSSDNFVIFSPSRSGKRFRVVMSKWLIKVGFDLRKKRFKMSHSRKKVCFLNKKAKKNIIFPGFALCGFFFQHYKFRRIACFKKNVNLAKKRSFDRNLIYQITITPSKKKLKLHLNKLSYTIFSIGIRIHHRTLIESINPTIWNWCNYFRYYNCKTRFRLRQYITFCMIKQWSKKFLKRKIFRKRFFSMSKKANSQSETITYLNIMSVKTIRKILLHTDFTPKIFIQVSKKFSIFNKDRFYFNKRFSTLRNLLLHL